CSALVPVPPAPMSHRPADGRQIEGGERAHPRPLRKCPGSECYLLKTLTFPPPRSCNVGELPHHVVPSFRITRIAYWSRWRGLHRSPSPTSTTSEQLPMEDRITSVFGSIT